MTVTAVFRQLLSPAPRAFVAWRRTRQPPALNAAICNLLRRSCPDNPPMRDVQATNFAAASKADNPDGARAAGVGRGRDDLS
jgi:hypothetical protein